MTRISHKYTTFRRFLQFYLVGATGVLVDMAVLFILANAPTLHWDLPLSKLIADETAMVNNFIWNEVWTFRDLSAGETGRRARLKRLAKFNLICTAGIAMNVVLLTFQVRTLEINLYIANLISIFLVSIWNFGMNLKFGWSRPLATGIPLLRK